MGEKKHHELTLSEITAFLNGIENDENIKHISFSGGEIIWHSQREKVYKLVAYANQKGKMTSIITNAYWGENAAEAKKIIQTLKSVGLNALVISYDTFHQEFVPVQSVATVYNLCREFDIMIEIQSVVLRGQQIVKDIDLLNRLTGGIRVGINACYPVGKAIENYEENDFIRIQEPIGLYCRKSGSFSVDYDGSIWPCCSPFVTVTQLCVGNIREGINYRIALERLKNNDILKNIRRHGFDYLKKMAIQNNILIPNKIISSCEICALFFENKTNKI